MSVCSGVEAASLAWETLGWEPFAFSEIEPFPCAVLAAKWPKVPNLGDMTKINIKENGDIEYGQNDTIGIIPSDGRTIDLIVGGTPCQDASCAGKRAGLIEGSRSKLAFTYTRLAYELATYRGLRWICWENVPGVFSLNSGRDFAAFLSSLVGREIAPPERGWKNFGIVPQSSDGNFGVAWRVLDCQYARVDGFPRAIPQRRRRVFLVGHLGDWRRAAGVLFEPTRLLGNTPPRRRSREETAQGTEGCAVGAGGNGSDDNVISLVPYGMRLGAHTDGVASTIARIDTKFPQCVCDARDPIVLDMQGGKTGCHFSEDGTCPTITRGRGSINDVHSILMPEKDVCLSIGNDQYVGCCNPDKEICGTLNCMHEPQMIAKIKSIECEAGQADGRKTGEDDSKIIAFEPGIAKREGNVCRFADGVSPTLRTNMGDNQTAVCVAGSQEPMNDNGCADAMNTNDESEKNCICQAICTKGNGDAFLSDVHTSLTASAGGQAGQGYAAALVCDSQDPVDGPGISVAIPLDMDKLKPSNNTTEAFVRGGRKGGNGFGVGEEGDPSYTLNTVDKHGVAYKGYVRRLLPVETERLMGFPDGHTIPVFAEITDELVKRFIEIFYHWNCIEAKDPSKVRRKSANQVRAWLERVGNPGKCPDAPRYKACGNSMAVNCMRWIGTRINKMNGD